MQSNTQTLFMRLKNEVKNGHAPAFTFFEIFPQGIIHEEEERVNDEDKPDQNYKSYMDDNETCIYKSDETIQNKKERLLDGIKPYNYTRKFTMAEIFNGTYLFWMFDKDCEHKTAWRDLLTLEYIDPATRLPYNDDDLKLCYD